MDVCFKIQNLEMDGPPVSLAASGGKKGKGKLRAKSFTMSLGDFQKTSGTSSVAARGMDSRVASAADIAFVAGKQTVERHDPKDVFRGYTGKINPRCYKPQYVLINDVRDSVLFSQKTVSDFNVVGNCDVPISELADSMFLGFDSAQPLDVVYDESSKTFASMDNRRLLIAKKLGAVDSLYGIWVRVHAADAKLNRFEQRRFLAKTWGEAVEVRKGEPGVEGFLRAPTILSNGMPSKMQNLSLYIDQDTYDYSALKPEEFASLLERRQNGCVEI